MDEKKTILIVGANQKEIEQAASDVRNKSSSQDNLRFYFARGLDDAQSILEAVEVLVIAFFALAGRGNDNRFFISSLRSLFRGEIIGVAEERTDRQALLGTECDMVLRPDELAQAVLEMTDE